jgi:hypothetical protein
VVHEGPVLSCGVLLPLQHSSYFPDAQILSRLLCPDCWVMCHNQDEVVHEGPVLPCEGIWPLQGPLL